MLVYSVLRPLGCAVYVATIPAAHVLVYDHAFLNGRHSIFLNCKKHFLSEENDTRFHSTIAHVDSTLALLFKFQ